MDFFIFCIYHIKKFYLIIVRKVQQITCLLWFQANQSLLFLLNDSDTLSWFQANQSLLFLLNAVCLAKKQQNTNFIVIGLTRLGLEPTIYHTSGEHLTITPSMNPRSTTLQVSTLTITPSMNPRSTTLQVSTLTITPSMNLRSTTLQVSTLTITPLMLFSCIKTFVNIMKLYLKKWQTTAKQ